MALIENITDFNKYVTVAADFDDDKLLKYSKKAERNIIKIIGQAAFDNVEEETPAHTLLCEYVANLGLSYALPALVINITSYGTFTNTTTDTQRAEWWQLKDLNRTLLKFAFNALDDALQEIGLEDNDLLADLFVSSVAQFDRVFSIGGSAQTFLSLISFLREAQDQYLRATLGDCYTAEFTESQKYLIRAALVNLALSKAATSGSFSIEANGILLRYEVLPWERVEKTEQSALEKFKIDRYNIGMGYLNQVLQFATQMPCYQINKFESEIERKKSGLYL